MDWLSFFIGALVGWIVEWMIDLYYWRRKYQTLQEDDRLLRARLEAAQAEIHALERKLKRNEPRPAPARQIVTEPVLQVPDLPTEGTLLETANLDGTLPVDAAGSDMRRPDRHEAIAPAAAGQADDLVQIEGIGPKIAQLLNDNGILTFAQLAATPPDRLSLILHDAGPRYKLADPGSWPEQARLAADGAWDELQALQTRLTAGRQRPHPAH